MGRQVWIQRDAAGNVVSSTEVRSTSGCSGCLWVLLGIFVVCAPAAWAANGTVPVAAAVLMYLAELALAAVWAAQRGRGRN